MTDDVIHLSDEETQAIIDWAGSVAAMFIIMDNAPRGESDPGELGRLEKCEYAIEIMRDNMPEVLVSPAAIIAQKSMDEAVEEEVERFREQLKDM